MFYALKLLTVVINDQALEGCWTTIVKVKRYREGKRNVRTKQSATVVERLKLLKAGQNAWQPDLPKHLQLNVKGARLSNIYKRLLPDQPAYTVTGSGGGGTHMYHWEEPRALTNRERARLQTFPDNLQLI